MENFDIPPAKFLRPITLSSLHNIDAHLTAAMRFVASRILQIAHDEIVKVDAFERSNGDTKSDLSAVLITGAILTHESEPEHCSHISVRDFECAFEKVPNGSPLCPTWAYISLEELLVRDDDVVDWLRRIFGPLGYELYVRVDHIDHSFRVIARWKNEYYKK